MGIETQRSARLHEHTGRVAVRIGDGETIYLSPELATNLATELQIAALQIHNGYHYSTTNIEEK